MIEIELPKVTPALLKRVREHIMIADKEHNMRFELAREWQETARERNLELMAWLAGDITKVRAFCASNATGVVHEGKTHKQFIKDLQYRAARASRLARYYMDLDD